VTVTYDLGGFGSEPFWPQAATNPQIKSAVAAAIAEAVRTGRSLRRERYGLCSGKSEGEAREHGEVSVKLHLLLAATPKRRQPHVRFEMGERPLHCAAPLVEVAEAVGVPRDSREEATAEADGQDWLLALDALKRDDGFDAPGLALDVDANVVVALVHGDGLGWKPRAITASRSGAEYMDSFRRAVSTRHAIGRPVRVQTARVQLPPVEAPALARRDSGAMPPGRFRVGVPLAFFASLVDVALTDSRPFVSGAQPSTHRSDTGRMQHARNGAAIAVLVVGLGIHWRWIADVFSEILSDPFSILGFVVVAYFALPFIAVAAGIADGQASLTADTVALGIAIAGTVLVPRLVSESIKDDPSSTAALAHLWDPVPTTLAVGAVFGVDYLVQRRFAKPS
jgi:hypothetical protein